MKVGIIVAVELEAIKELYGEPNELIKAHSQEILKYNRNNKEIYVIQSGAGPIGAAASTQLLICEISPTYIFNFGVVGALTEELSRERLCLVSDVIDYCYDTSCADKCEVGRHMEYPTIKIPLNRELILMSMGIKKLPEVICASGSKFVGDEKEKREIRMKFAADIIDMESAAIVLTCDKNKVPCLMVKMVADSLNGGQEEFFREFNKSAKESLNFLDKIISKI